MIRNGAIILGNAYIISTGHRQIRCLYVGTPSFIHLVKASTNRTPNNIVGIITILLIN